MKQLQFVVTNDDTLHTPYNYGITGASSGITMIAGRNGWITILLIPVSFEKLFVIRCTNNTWGKWREITTTECAYQEESISEPSNDSDSRPTI